MIDASPRSKARKSEIEDEQKSNRMARLLPESLRYNERSTVERVNGRLKDEFSGRSVRVPAKVMTYLMFGILALTIYRITSKL